MRIDGLGISVSACPNAIAKSKETILQGSEKNRLVSVNSLKAHPRENQGPGFLSNATLG
jgi:hypothetical protein